MKLANGARGEVIAVLAGEPRRLCLTLGALAELETAFGLEGWEPLAERLRALSPNDLMVTLAALLRGGGEAAAAEQFPALPLTAPEAVEAVARALRAAGT